jgi:hypothetical protein
MSGIPAGTVIEADGVTFEVTGAAAWVPGWTKLAPRWVWTT